MIVDEAHHLHWSERTRVRIIAWSRLCPHAAPVYCSHADPRAGRAVQPLCPPALAGSARFHSLEEFIAEESQYRRWSATLEALEAGATPEDLPEGGSIGPDTGADRPDSRPIRHWPGIVPHTTRAGISGFPQRHLHRHPLPQPEEYAHASLDLEDKLHPGTAYFDDSWLAFDPRVDWLEQTLKSLRPPRPW